MKFNMKAQTKVTRNQPNLLRKYLRYPFTQHLLVTIGSLYQDGDSHPVRAGMGWVERLAMSDAE
jgi:hypothetical protein